MTGATRDDSVLRRLSQYLYVADLIAGKRVLEVGCGAGVGAQFLADHGAARVVGIDADAALIEHARDAHRLSNLDFRAEDPKAIELDDDTFDCIFVPDGAELLRRDIVLMELRRLLVADGYLLFAAPSADRPSAVGGVSYYDLVDRLQEEFAPVRMVAQTPMVAVSLVQYAGDDTPEATIELDTTLMEHDEGDVTGYLAVCGGTQRDLRGYAIIQWPALDGVEQLRAAIDPSGRRTDAEAQLEKATARIAELELAFGRRVVERTSDRPLRRQLEHVSSEKQQLEAQTQALRRQLDAAQLDIGRVAGETALEMNRLRAGAGVLRSRVLELEGVVSVRTDGGVTTDQIDRALAAHADAMAEIESVVAERDAFISELGDELDAARAAGAAASDRAAVRDLELAAVAAQLADARSRAATAEGLVLRMRAEGTGEGGDGGADAAERVAELEGQLADATDRLDRATANWREAETKSDEVWRRVGELQSELESHRESAIAKSAEQRREGKRELAHAMESSSAKLVGAKNELLKVERERDLLAERCAQLEVSLDEAETARAELEQSLVAETARRLHQEAELFEAEPTYAAGRAPLPAAGVGGGGSSPNANHLAQLGAHLSAIETELALQRDVFAHISAGLAELREVSLAEYDEQAAQTRVAELSMELGIKDAEVTLFDIGVKSLQSRVRGIVDDVAHARTVMQGHGVDEIMRQMDVLVDKLTRLRGPNG